MLQRVKIDSEIYNLHMTPARERKAIQITHTCSIHAFVKNKKYFEINHTFLYV